MLRTLKRVGGYLVSPGSDPVSRDKISTMSELGKNMVTHWVSGDLV